MATAVEGYRELAAAFAKADKQTRRGLPLVMREAAEPVRGDSQLLARAKIRRIGDKWSEMRTGVTRTLVYVAPKKRGTKVPELKRKNLAPLMMERALEPALARHEADIEHRVERALDRLATDFNRGGPI